MVAAKKPVTARDPFSEAPASRFPERTDHIGGLPTMGGSRPSVMPIGNLDAWMQTQRTRQFERQFACQSTRGSDEEGRRPENGARCRSLVADQARRLNELTEQVFPPGAFDIRLELDPDEPEHEYIVFSVHASGEFRDIFDREYRWHDEAEKIVGGPAAWLRLSVYPR